MLQILIFLNIFINCLSNDITNSTKLEIKLKSSLKSNYTRKQGERIRLECNFEIINAHNETNSDNFMLYWIKNYQEILKPKMNQIQILQKDMKTVLIIKNLDIFDSGSYQCIAELNLRTETLNKSDETTIFVTPSTENQSKRKKQKTKNSQSNIINYDLDDENLSEEFPALNPTLVENFDNKGFCEPYHGSICSGVLSKNYSIYSSSMEQQNIIEDRLKKLLPVLFNFNLSNRCSDFVLPSLCYSAFPACDKNKDLPKQICRLDCNQIKHNICKSEYLNFKSIFKSSLSNDLDSFNLMLDCNRLPPSSDSHNDCLPIVSLTIDSIDRKISNIGVKDKNNNNNNYIINSLYIFVPSICMTIFLVFLFFIFCLCKKSNTVQDSITKQSNSQEKQETKIRVSTLSLTTNKNLINSKNQPNLTDTSKSSFYSSIADQYIPISYENYVQFNRNQPVSEIRQENELNINPISNQCVKPNYSLIYV